MPSLSLSLLLSLLILFSSVFFGLGATFISCLTVKPLWLSACWHTNLQPVLALGGHGENCWHIISSGWFQCWERESFFGWRYNGMYFAGSQDHLEKVPFAKWGLIFECVSSFFLLLQVYEVFYTSIILSRPHSHKKHLEMFLCNFLISLNGSLPFSLPILFNLFLS